MPGMRSLWVCLAALLLLVAGAQASVPVPEGAFGADAYDEGAPRVEARLLFDTDVARPGSRLRVGVLFDLDPGWHIYWRNPGESGVATQLIWDVPQSEVGPIQWPAPLVFAEADGFITTYGYEDQVLLASELALGSELRGKLRIAEEWSWPTPSGSCWPSFSPLCRIR